MIKTIILGITMVIINSFMTSLYTKRKKMTPSAQNPTHYAIQIPSEATKVFLTMMYFGAFLFAFFFILLLIGNESITIGHFVFTTIFSAIGAVIALWSKSWIVLVDGNNLEYHSLFHKKEVFTFDQIEKVETDSKGAVGIFFNKKRVIVSALCDNQSYLIESLKAHGKWNLNTNEK